MTSRDRWVRHTRDKRPISPSGRPASSTDPSTWTSYRVAQGSPAGAGLGFVLNGDGIVCLDLDHCLRDGVIAAWARPIIDRCPPTYIEFSPSGDGLHVWGRGQLGKGRRLRVGAGTAEIYATGRYITVTGRRYSNSPNDLADLGEVISELTV